MTLDKSIETHYGKKVGEMRRFQTGNYGETYKVSLDSEAFVVKVFPETEAGSLGQMLDLLHYINEHNIQVPNPMKTLDNQWFVREVLNEKPVMYYVYPFLEGINLEDTIQEAIEGGLLNKLGSELARLHQFMRSYPAEYLKDKRKWNEVEGLMVIYEIVHEDIPKTIVEVYHSQREALNQLQLCENQVVHSDMHLANILLSEENKAFRFIDMDECVIGNPVMDIAVLCFDLPVICTEEELWQKGLKDLLTGYEEVTPLEQKEKEAIPIMLKLLEIASYINYYAYREVPDPWFQHFFEGRRDKILKNEPYITLKDDCMTF